MTERATGRHRASQKSVTSPLATLTGPLSVVGDCVGAVRRSGVIIAMSSGLVATMALPAHAVTNGPAEVSGPQTASVPVVGDGVPAGGSSAFFASPEGGLLALPPGLALEDGTVSAPAAATLDFDQTGFVAVPTPVDLGLGGSRTGSTTRGGNGPSLGALTGTLTRTGVHVGSDADRTTGQSTGQSTRTAAPTTRREARKARPATTATANTGAATTAASVATTVQVSRAGSSAVSIASRYLGVPYRFGGSSPRGFDCSGLVQYVFAQLGHKLPRTAAAQAAAVRHIPRSQARPGDLVLFPGGGHIGIYVGNGKMLDAPRTGQVVQIRKIYSSNVSFGRVA